MMSGSLFAQMKSFSLLVIFSVNNDHLQTHFYKFQSLEPTESTDLILLNISICKSVINSVDVFVKECKFYDLYIYIFPCLPITYFICIKT
jgi:hypothetical protein